MLLLLSLFLGVESHAQEAKRQWRLSADAHSFLVYAGNIFNQQNDTLPFLTHDSGTIIPGWTFYRAGHKQGTWQGFSLVMQCRNNRQVNYVSLLDDDLLPIPGEAVREMSYDRTLFLRLGYSWEHWTGEGRLKGLYGYGLMMGTERNSYELRPVNPLESYAGMTLGQDSRYSFNASSAFLFGLNYSISEDIFIRASSTVGLQLDVNVKGQKRLVQENGASVSVVQSEIGGIGSRFSMQPFLSPSISFLININGPEQSQ